MAKRQHIPTADEIRALNEARATPHSVDRSLITENLKLKQRIEELEKLLVTRGPGSVSTASLAEMCAKRNIQPAEELLRMIQDNEVNSDQKIRILTELLGYQMPKLKSVEQRSTSEVNVTVVVRKFGERVQRELPRQAIIDVAAKAIKANEEEPI